MKKRPSRKQRRYLLADMKLRPYGIVAEAVENGITYGLRHSQKHSDNPVSETVLGHMANEVHLAVMNELSEIIDWGNGECGEM